MNKECLYVLLVMVLFSNCKKENFVIDNGEWADAPNRVSTIAFGSCAEEYEQQPILQMVADRNPDLFIYLGDNVYGDTEDMQVLENKYAELSQKEEFKNLALNSYILSTWDDHDYGENDAGKYYPQKEASKEVFLDFFREPKSSERRMREGIYDARIFNGDDNKKVQIILLDTRTFRDDLIRNDGMSGCKNIYCPNPSPDSTLLGEAQWTWLESQLQEDADIRIIASSIQFSHQYNGRESWTTMPREQEKFIGLLQTHQVNAVFFISGDLHLGEISKMEVDGAYPLYDITSSGITKNRIGYDEQNSRRIGNLEEANNYGWIEIDWDANPIQVTGSIININGDVSNMIVLDTDEISF